MEVGDKIRLIDNKDLPPSWLLSIGMRGSVIKQHRAENGIVVSLCLFKNLPAKFQHSDLIPLANSRLELL